MYVHRNVSAATSFRVNAARSNLPIGALIHTTAGRDSLSWLQGGSAVAGKPASSDFLISRDGTRFEISPIGRYAYHAGISKALIANRNYRDEELSEILIGIELEAMPSEQITREQYFSLAELLNILALTYKWKGDYPIYGHYAVAIPMGRRSDPTNFDWGVLYAILRGGA